MSKLALNLNAKKTDRLYADQDLSCLSWEGGWSTPSFNCSSEYRIQAVFGATRIIPEDSSAEICTLAVKHAKEMIVNEVFGEYREPLLELLSLAYARGNRRSVEIIEGMLSSMFKV
jgi:hypothetical protein